MAVRHGEEGGRIQAESFYQSLCLWWAQDISFLLQAGGPLPGSKRGSCLTLGHTSWQSKLYWEGAPEQRGGGSGNPGELLCHVACSLGFYGDGVSFQVVSGQSFWLRVLPGGAHLVQPRWMPARRILGGGRTCGVSFWPFLNSSGWWWLISSMFLTRTSCHKTLIQMVTMLPGHQKFREELKPILLKLF